jgi:hypothetical protein
MPDRSPAQRLALLLASSALRGQAVEAPISHLLRRNVPYRGGSIGAGGDEVDPIDISDEMQRVQADFRRIIGAASADDLRRRSHGTRWTNRQLLFHMVFGYLIVRTLMPLVHARGRLGHSRGFAATLNSVRRPFHVINYLGSCGGGQILTTRAMAALLDRTITALQRRLAAETESSLALTMHFPTAWDPYFTPTMSVLDVYHFGTQHFVHHRRQLTL